MTHHIIIVLSMASALMLWFRSDMPVTATKVLRWLGWKKNALAFWPEDPIDYDFWIRDKWSHWAALRSSGYKPARLFVHLINCPYCCAFHMSWILGLSLGLCVSWTDALWALTYPFLSIFLYRFTNV